MRPLTRKQQEVYDFIEAFIKENHYSPSVREIMAAVNLKSSSTVAGHLNNIKDKGYITWIPSFNRTIRVLEHAI
ncbi:LexA repressor [Alkalicoccobacillus gibsonii]|uniref:LexA family protein n=1 Tax=Alkalicoccobacillus gibsonii TaxID=79881 RepID=UPI003F7C5023